MNKLIFALGAILFVISPPTVAQDDYLTFTQAVTDDVDGFCRGYMPISS
jgi:hypothetical protein